MRVGYARVSSPDQSLDIQLERLADCEKVFAEKVSGTTAQRPQLKICLDFVREGDVLVITRLDRLARSNKHLYAIVARLEEKGVALQVVEQALDTSTVQGKLMFAMLGAIAEFETGLRAERQREGIERARREGVPLGRRKALSDAQVKELYAARQQGVLIKELQQRYRLSKAGVYKYLKKMPADKVQEEQSSIPPGPYTMPQWFYLSRKLVEYWKDQPQPTEEEYRGYLQALRVGYD